MEPMDETRGTSRMGILADRVLRLAAAPSSRAPRTSLHLRVLRALPVLFASVVLPLCVAQGLSPASGAPNGEPASVTVFVDPASTPIRLTGVSLAGSEMDLVLSSGVSEEVAPGAYSLEVGGAGSERPSRATRTVFLESGATYAFSYDVRTEATGTVDGATILWVVVLMVFLVITLSAAMILYFRQLQIRYYDLTASLVGRVADVDVVMSSTMAPEAPVGGRLADAEGSVPSLRLRHPRRVGVGLESKPFVVEGDADADVAVEWSVEPSETATVQASADGRSATVLAAKAGVFRVTAAVGDGADRAWHRTVPVVATADDPSGSFELPWVGQGIGAFVIGVLVLGITFVLAVAGVFDATATSTLLVALAGYAFGQARRET